MWHEFGRLRQWPPSLSCDPALVALEVEFKGTSRSSHKPHSIGSERKLNLQEAAPQTFYKGTFNH